jgi:flavin-binding protein dodecin
LIAEQETEASLPPFSFLQIRTRGEQINTPLAVPRRSSGTRKLESLPRMDLAHDRIKTPGRRRCVEITTLTLQRRFAMPATTEMKDHVYKILDLVGSSETSIEDAIQNAITRASKTIREMKWFEVVQTRGHIENGSVRHYQVTLRVGFTLEG